MEIIGHRGAMWDAPENTLVSFRMGWEQKADIVECDVHLTVDGKIVTIHDASTLRTGGVDLKVAETTSDELRKVDVGRFKGEQFSGERIPFLEEALETMPPQGKFFVEIKCGSEIVQPLKRLLQETGKAPQTAVIGFDLDVISDFKQAMPEVPVYWLRSTPRDASGAPQPHSDVLIEQAANRGIDGLNLHYEGVTKALAKAVKDAGQRLYVWVINDPEQARRLIAMGIDGFGTDRPGWMRQQLGL
ncbi:MAG: glycerophosphodiester phosphodiesterase [Armatimonadota bacterium]|nr:glycerophosphodiester phosphodiesterase [Armatimonadota bacterium]